jgi:hypothetical protein
MAFDEILKEELQQVFNEADYEALVSEEIDELNNMNSQQEEERLFGERLEQHLNEQLEAAEEIQYEHSEEERDFGQRPGLPYFHSEETNGANDQSSRLTRFSSKELENSNRQKYVGNSQVAVLHVCLVVIVMRR